MYSLARSLLSVGWPALLLVPSWILLGRYVAGPIVPLDYKGAILAAVPLVPLLVALTVKALDWRQTPAAIWAGVLCATFNLVLLVVGLVGAFHTVPLTLPGLMDALSDPNFPLDFSGLLAASVCAGLGASAAISGYRGTAKRVVRSGHKRSERTAFGSSRTAKRSEVQALISAKEGIPIGEWRDGRSAGSGDLLRFPSEGNLMTIAPMGGGKGRSGVGPALLAYDGAVAVTDPKGENAAVWAYSRRLLGRRVAVLAPLEIPAIGPQPWCYNPFDYIRPGMGFQESVNELAEAIVVHHPDDKAHFTEITKVMIAGAIAWIYDTFPAERRTLGSMYDFFTQPGDSFMAACADMVQRPHIGQGMPAQLGKTWMEVGTDERGSIWSTLLRNIVGFNDPQMRRATGSSNFDIYDFGRDRLDLFLCLPFTAMKNHSRWLRLMIAMCVGVVVHRPPNPDAPRALLVLDELPTLGAMSALIDKASGAGAVTVGRAQGLQIWAFLQHPNQLPALYGQDVAKTWRGTNAVFQVFGTSASDVEFPEEVSKLLGDMTVEIESDNTGEGAQRRGFSLMSGRSNNRGVTRSDQKRRLMTPDEIRRLPRDQQILFVNDIGYPIITERADYDKRPEWRFRYMKNPYVRAPQPYALVRSAEAARAVVNTSAA